MARTTADIVVYGGTPAGVVAAVTAKRADPNLAVVLIESSQHLGGMMSNGLGWSDIGNTQTIGGYAREVFNRIEAIEGSASNGGWDFEPHVAEQVMDEMTAGAGIDVRYGQRLAEQGAVTKVGSRIVAIRMESGEVYAARTFIDASYEGDLMAAAGVSYTVGRESSAQYGEPLAGVQVAEDTGITLPAGVGLPSSSGPPGPLGSGDDRTQDMNYRLCFSSDPADQVPFSAPAGYSPAEYGSALALIAHKTAAGGTADLGWFLTLEPLPDHKFDVNNGSWISLALTGANTSYADGSYATRAAIDAEHKTWTEGLLYFLSQDPEVPATIRTELDGYGLCADEFTDNGNWPRLLYLREGRRMLGEYVLRQSDTDTNVTKPDIIGVASYRTDAHFVSRWVDASGRVWMEGRLSAPHHDYAIPYRIMLPRPTEATNLLVVVTSSASHVAQSSLRMEPQYMVMGEAAGEAAAMTVEATTTLAVDAVNVGRLQGALRAQGAYLPGALTAPSSPNSKP